MQNTKISRSGIGNYQLLVRDPKTAVLRTTEGDRVFEHVPEPKQRVTAFLNAPARARAVDWAASIGNRTLATRWADKPILDDAAHKITVAFVTPDEELGDLPGILDEDLAWDQEGRFAPWLSQATYVVDGVAYEGCAKPFRSAEDRQSAFERIQAAQGLTGAQRRRLLERVSATPILA